MKKLIIAILMLITSATTYAQFNKGRMLVGGQLGFTSQKNDGSTMNQFSFAPQFGYFLINNLAIGASLDFSIFHANDYTSTSISLGPYVRYYLKPGIFFQGNYGLGTRKANSDNNYDPYESKFTTNNWGLSAGYAFFINDHVSIEPILGYNWTKSKYSGDGIISEQNYTTTSLDFRIGLQIYLGRKE